MGLSESTGRRLTIGVAFAVWLASPFFDSRALAQPQDYQAGLDALRGERYRDAVRLLERAVSVKAGSESGYYPYFHLGRAHRCLGDDARAKAYFEQSFIFNEVAEERELIQALDKQLTKNPPACAQIPVHAGRIVPTVTIAADVKTSTTTVPFATTTVALPPTQTPKSRLATLLEEGRRLADAGQIQEARQKLDQAEQIARQDPEVLLLVGSLEEKARKKARDAVVSQMQGRYDHAIAGLKDALPALPKRSQPTAHLFLAWAWYAKYLIGGEGKQELAAEARAQMRIALDLNPDLKADPRVVSPRLRELMDQVQREAHPRP